MSLREEKRKRGKENNLNEMPTYEVLKNLKRKIKRKSKIKSIKIGPQGNESLAYCFKTYIMTTVC